jgi:hypothetical protein
MQSRTRYRYVAGYAREETMLATLMSNLNIQYDSVATDYLIACMAIDTCHLLFQLG